MDFCSIASGSSGNSLYVGTKHTRILIDAGLSGKRIQDGLASLHIAGDQIDALFITHEHQDHIKGAGIFSRRFDVPIYATMETWNAMEKDLGKIAPRNRCYVYEGENCVINDVCLCPFAIPHDAADPVGYSIFAENKKITIATDFGHVTDTIRENIADSNLLLLEANHDERMVQAGSYPFYLKQRILGERGHISNATAGKLLTEALTGNMQHILLGHLSAENNHPSLAYETVSGILQEHHIKLGGALKMQLASRTQAGMKITI